MYFINYAFKYKKDYKNYKRGKMKRILLVDRIYLINTRNKRIIDSLKEKHEIKFCAWNRESRKIEEDNNYIYSSNEGYGKKIKKLLGMRKYLSFIKKVISEYKPDIIIASQWDMLLLTILSNFKGKIIYENLDIPSNSSRLILKILLILEKWMLKKVDGIIFASRFFLPLYSQYKGRKLLLENLPLKETDRKQEIELEKREKIRISFIGSLRYFETMKNLLFSIQESSNIEVYLIGKGAENYKFKELIKKQNLKNIFMVDEYKYEEIKKFYLNTDLIWAVYPNKNYNVKFAISNKFFESILFEKPCFFAKDTLLGDFVEKHNIGIVVDPYDVEEIKKKTEKLNKKAILELQKNIKKYKKEKDLYWENQEAKLLEFINRVGE